MLVQITEKGTYLSKKSNRLVVKQSGKVQKEISLDNVDVIILGKGIAFSSDLLVELCEAGITIFFDFNNKYFVSSSSFLSTPETRIKQINLSDDKKFFLAKGIIFTKVHNQFSLLRSFGLNAEIDLSNPQNMNELLSFEAQNAKNYWKNVRNLLGHQLFTSREPRKGDIVNSSLDYSYGIIRNLVFKAVLNSGLDPYFGYIHQLKNYKPTMVFDIMEIFRPIADFTVISLLLEKEWESFAEIKYLLAKNLMKMIYSEFEYRNQKTSLFRIMSLQCFNIANYIAHDEKLEFFRVNEWKRL
ncbi:MAG: CRISPR-associated endonuclease Cas1 [Candidatus Anstonellales archaeon]